MNEISHKEMIHIFENSQIQGPFGAEGLTATYVAALSALRELAEREKSPGEISDGYHTFNELYHHRAVLFSVICNDRPDAAWKSKLHHDGTMYDGMFIVGIETPNGQATYHYDIDPYWDMFRVPELPQAPEWILCLKCGRYREAHKGACDGCRWKENFKMLNAEKDRSYLLKHYGHNFPAHAKYVRKPNRIYFATDFDDGEKITFAWMCDQPNANARGNATYYSPAKGFQLINIKEILPDMEAECAGCENWSGVDCALIAPDTGCPYA